MAIPEEIERVALLGWRVYPSSQTTKHARFKEPGLKASFDLDVIAGWVKLYGDSNWRVVMEGSGIWGLDVDVPSADHAADGVVVMAGMVAEHGALPLRPTTRSGGGGYAVFFKHEGEPVWGKTGHPHDGLDPRVGKLSVTIPPSIHITTKRSYTWLVPPWTVDPPKAPDWLLKAVAPPFRAKPRMPEVTTTSRAERRLRTAVDLVLSAPAGRSNDTLNRQAFALGRHIAAGALSEATAAEALYCAAMHRHIPSSEARDTIRSGFRGGYAKPLDLAATR